jgi:hypothetical protein
VQTTTKKIILKQILKRNGREKQNIQLSFVVGQPLPAVAVLQLPALIAPA